MATVIPVQPWSINSEEISVLISESSPDVTCAAKGEYFCSAARSSRLGATIQIRYDTVTVKGGFPTFLGQALFSLFVVGLGVIPPLIVYYFTFHLKMKAFEKELSTCITNGAMHKGILREPQSEGK